MNLNEIEKVYEILLIEDNPGHAKLTEEALNEGERMHNLNIVEDGIEAMAFLRKEGNYLKSPRPDLILLDLNMPRMDGREVLTEIKKDPNLSQIPIIVLTTSNAEEDIRISYNQNANCYITKPVDLGEFIDIVNHIKEFWFKIVKLPPPPD